MRAATVFGLLLTALPAAAQDMPLFTFLPPGGKWEKADAGPTSADAKLPPSPATVLTPDGGTQFTASPDTPAVLAFRVNKDGRGVDPAPYCPLRLRKGEAKLTASALTLDTAGRIYAATADGIQVFDPTGRLSGVIALPAKGLPSALSWEGAKRDRLAVRIGTETFTRPMAATGVMPKR